MTSYNLSALMKIREQKRNSAEIDLRQAIQHHSNETAKLKQIETSLKDTITARSRLHDSFFLKAQMTPCNKTEILCHISSKQKNILDEHLLRKAMADQTEAVKGAAKNVEIAQNNALDAHRNLKIIEKHHDNWQQQKKRAEEMKEEYESDDLNGVRYLLHKA